MKLSVKTKELAELRIRRGLSQTALAEKAGVTGGFISQIERGLYRPSPKVAHCIAEALGAEFDDIFSLDDPQQTEDDA